MKEKYEIYMTPDGNPNRSGVRMIIEAESEFEAIQKAQQNYPKDKVATVRKK